MKQSVIILFTLFTLISSCKKEDTKPTGFITFGANYHVVNCITNVTIYIDGKFMGELKVFADSITDCNTNAGLTKELEIGHHYYKVKIRPESGIGLSKDIAGQVDITENCCEIVFVDYFKLNLN